MVLSTRSIHNQVIPKFPGVKGQFLYNNDKFDNEMKILYSHLLENKRSLSSLTSKLWECKDDLIISFGKILASILEHKIIKINRAEIIKSFKTKNKKLKFLLKKAERKTITKYSVPVINLSTYHLKNIEYQQLKLGLDYSYINKNKNTRKFLAANFETLAQRTRHYVEVHRLEEYHECLRGYTDIFTKNVFQTKDYTYHNLKSLIREKDVVVMKGDKDSSLVILNKTDYIEKLENMVKEGIDKGTYTITEDNTIKDLNNFKQFLKQNLKEYDKLDDMLPTSNQPARI